MVSAAVVASRKPITGTDSRCARAASGHATAPPPSSVMNARRLMGAPPQVRAAHYHTVAQEHRCASQQKLRADVADGQTQDINHAIDTPKFVGTGTRLRR